ncbi:LOW QUALITY PROTEIN: complement C1q and tumor necrosis factor-related protein 9A [Cottoperca gobio]|uniref:LOW QUALITY PROTEIN: complement C1q and tumor necrosis factor-related protein 9A n=1 Tax=Cottoperca gobio TaxID=56716 RepID=A0A6J2RWJ8_COTGO|nr:LOW QUALITY PROTEIN: complement C1q and tumor necrosis factor-related protein 9A-like [Cottoperca gobio]
MLQRRFRVTLLLLLLAVRCVTQEQTQIKDCICGHPGIPGDPGHNGTPGRDGRDGLRGDKGDQGQAGPVGSAGNDGHKGDKGEHGAVGSAGLKGKRGENGERGPPGKMGPQGVQGSIGLKGNKGELGLPGPQGLKGDYGPLGPDGPKGEIGLRGDRGIQGPMGPPGRPGSKGDIGVPGHKGNIGYRGDRGTRGEKGDNGEKGDALVISKSAFSVGLTAQSKLPAVNAPIRFDKIIYNEQNHYDLQTGRFTCSAEGAYFFTYHITVYSRNVKVALVKNGAKIIHTTDTYQSSEDQAAGGAVLHLDVGDKVWLQVAGGELYNGLFADEDDDTTFSGFLIFGT